MHMHMQQAMCRQCIHGAQGVRIANGCAAEARRRRASRHAASPSVTLSTSAACLPRWPPLIVTRAARARPAERRNGGDTRLWLEEEPQLGRKETQRRPHESVRVRVGGVRRGDGGDDGEAAVRRGAVTRLHT